MRNAIQTLAVLTPCLLLVPSSASAEVLASWDVWADTDGPRSADTVLAGFSATVSTGSYHAAFGSTDGTFGADLTGASTSTGGLLFSQQNNQSSVNIVLTNNSGSVYDIQSLHFDFAPRQQDTGSRGYNNFTLTYVSGGLGPDSTVIDTQSALPYIITQGQDQVAEGQYPDYDYDLSVALSDTTLDTGESATFRLDFSGQTSVSVSSILDNVAFVGVPEPATLTLISLGCVLIVHRRAS